MDIIVEYYFIQFDKGLIVGGDEKVLKYRLDNGIEFNFKDFVQSNETKRKSQEVKLEKMYL